MQPKKTLSQKTDIATRLYDRGILTPVETWGRIYEDFECLHLAGRIEYALKGEPLRTNESSRLLRQEMVEAGFSLVEKCAESKLPIEVVALRGIVSMLDVPSKDRTWLDDCSGHHSQIVRDFAVWYREQFLTRPSTNISRIRRSSVLQPGRRLRITIRSSYATFQESYVSDYKPLTEVVGTFVGFASWHPYLHESAFVVLDQEIIAARECHCTDEPDNYVIAQFPVKHLMMYGRQCINGFCTLGEKWSSAGEMVMTVEAHANLPTTYEEMHRRRGRDMRWRAMRHPLPIDGEYCSAPDAPIYLALQANFQVIENPSFRRNAEIVSRSIELHQALDALSIASNFNGVLTAIQRLLEREPSLILIAYPNLLGRLLDQSNCELNEAIREVLTEIGPRALPRLICTLRAACHYLFHWDPDLVGVIAGVLGKFGAQASEAVPILRGLLTHMPTVRDEITAALALIDKSE